VYEDLFAGRQSGREEDAAKGDASSGDGDRGERNGDNEDGKESGVGGFELGNDVATVGMFEGEKMGLCQEFGDEEPLEEVSSASAN
jgi:hypothetical protein